MQAKIPVIVAVLPDEEGEGFLLSVMRDDTFTTESYVETIVKPGHPLFEQFKTEASVLNIGDEDAIVEGMGETHAPGVYGLYISPEQRDEIVKGNPKE